MAAMTEPEFSRLFDVARLPAKPIELIASEAECKALARRFSLVRIDSLGARATLEDDGKAVTVRGRLNAEVVQSCAVSGEDLAVSIDDPIDLRFVAEATPEGDEIELAANELDEIPFDGISFDLGEQIAQSLGLAIDPFLTGPLADKVRKEVGLADEASSGPFAALAALKKD
jgi:uncharacterized metal-binding protein YceD (DUF177 family)